jgi:single-strand DNA-binding protein
MSGNMVLFRGRLGADAEIRQVPSGWLASFSACHSESYKDKNDEWQTIKTWAKVSWFSNYVEKVADELVKGREVFIEGKLKQNHWETDAGEKRSALEILVDRFGNVSILGMPTGNYVGTADEDEDEEEEEVAPPPKRTSRRAASGEQMPWQKKKSAA